MIQATEHRSAGYIDFRSVYGSRIVTREELRLQIWENVLADHCPMIMDNLTLILPGSQRRRGSLSWHPGLRLHRTSRQVPHGSSSHGSAPCAKATPASNLLANHPGCRVGE